MKTHLLPVFVAASVVSLSLLPLPALAQGFEPVDVSDSQKEAVPSSEAPPAETASTDAAKPRSASILLAPKLGLFKSTSPTWGALFVGAEVGYVTPLLDHRLAAVFDVSFHVPGAKGLSTDTRLSLPGGGDAGYVLSQQELAFHLSALYRHPGLAPNLTLYGGAGPGLFLHWAQMTAFGNTYYERESNLGAQALLGGEYAIGPGGAFLELRYHFTLIDFLATGDANIGGFLTGGLGYRFRF